MLFLLFQAVARVSLSSGFVHFPRSNDKHFKTKGREGTVVTVINSMSKRNNAS